MEIENLNKEKTHASKQGAVIVNLKKVKWCHTLGCNKKATNFIDKTTDIHPNEIRQVGYCYGHYVRSLTNNR